MFGVSIGRVKNKLKSYPNPLNDLLYINLPSAQRSTVIIYDVLGKAKLNQEFNKEEILINTNTFNQGVYIIKVIQGDKEKSQTFIKE